MYRHDKKQENFLEYQKMPILKIKKERDGILPTKAHEQDVGMDLTVISFEKKSKRLFLYNTHIKVEPPEGYYVEIVPRSSICFSDFILANSIGIIDPGYRGDLKLPLRYIGELTDEQAIEDQAKTLINTRVAQMILRQIHPCMIVEVESLSEAQRNEKGFGSTGKS
jgi:dUTP pyrophosphatase